jgi:hypothetical protein
MSTNPMTTDRPTPDAQRAILDALDGHARHTAAQLELFAGVAR